MGIRPAALKLIAGFFPAKRVLSLSYPDLVMSQDELEAIVGFRTEKESMCGAWHGRKHPLPETAEAFSRLGVEELRCVDIVASRGIEEIADLNYPQDFGAYDMVLDCGTTEHCANIWQATVNAAQAVKVGKVILHTPPLSMVNHGFWCPQPTFYADLYQQNGWDVLAMMLTDGAHAEELNNWTARFKVPPEVSLYVAARRTHDEPLKYPTQTKYLRNPTLT